MTVAAKDGFGISRSRMSGGGAHNPWRRLWQVPLLIASVVAFGFGVKALVNTIKPVPFETQVKGVQGLLAGGEYEKAVEEINMLGNYYKEPTQQGALQVLSGDAHFLAQNGVKGGDRVNYQRVQEHYHDAVLWGVELTPETNERWGIAALALGDAETAAEKLEAAMEAVEPDAAAALVKKHGRSLVAAYLEEHQPQKAIEMIDRLLKARSSVLREDLEVLDERTWALCKRIEIALHEGAHGLPDLEKALAGAREAIKEAGTGAERDPVGRVLAWIGRAEFERGDFAAAQRDLAAARERFAVKHLDDGRAAILLGRITRSQGDFKQAGALFQTVAAVHEGSSIWAAARLGRAEIATLQGTLEGEPMMGDFQYAIAAVKAVEESNHAESSHETAAGEKKTEDGDAEDHEERPPVGEIPEMITRERVRANIVQAYGFAANTGKYRPALAFLAMAQELDQLAGITDADLVLRQAIARERLADEMHAESQKLADAENDAGAAAKLAESRQMYAAAAADYERHSRLTTLNDDQSGMSLWKAGELWDRAGETLKGIEVYQRFTIQRPRDQRVPEGLLALGRLFESAGIMDKAIEIYDRNIKENPKTPAAYTTAVNLARCYAAVGERAPDAATKEQANTKAEATLLTLVQNNSDLEPQAREFKESLIALGEFYYRAKRWSDAILRLDEVVKRYPSDTAVARVRFMLGESYRKSAGEIGEALVKDPGIANRSALEQARSERLLIAAGEFARVIGLLDSDPSNDNAAALPQKRKVTQLEGEYLRTSHMDRAACYFERAEFTQAIKLYDQAASRFAEEVMAVEAYVQIVNAYLAMKEPAQAQRAASRGLWILKRVPDEAFTRSIVGATRVQYERLLTIGKP